MPTVTIPGVELVKAGTWNASTGTVTITPADLAAMVTADRDPTIDQAPVKLGHVDPRFDGEPALGWVRNLRLSSDGTTLIGDLADVPASLADILATAYPRRSVEVEWRARGQEKPTAVLTGLALLGVAAPAVKGLADVYRVAASAAFEIGDTPTIPPTTLPASDGSGQDAPLEEDRMDPATTAVAADATTDPAAPDLEPEDTVDDKPETDAADAAQAPEAVAAAAAPQTVTLSQGAYDELVAGAKAGAAALAAIDAQRRDAIITTALAEGRLAPADQATWRAALDRDETGTTALLATLPAQTVPTTALGSAHAAPTDPGETAWADFEKYLTGNGA